MRRLKAVARPVGAAVACLTLTVVVALTSALPLVATTAVAILGTGVVVLVVRAARHERERPVAEPVDWDGFMRDMEAWRATRRRDDRNPDRRP